MPQTKKTTTTKKQTIKPIPKPQVETGMDTKGIFMDNIIEAAQVGALDISSIDALNQSAQSREQFYLIIDSMATDDIIAAVLETYVEDTIQTNDKGQSIWVESDDPRVLDCTTYIMEQLQIQKHIYAWTYCLVTYGDLYIQTFRQSDAGDDLLFDMPEDKPQQLNEDVQIKIYSKNDPYLPYVEAVSNPGEMFDLQKFGKTHGYIQAPTRVQQYTTDELHQYMTQYKMKKTDVTIYDAKSFVHGCLEGTSQRQPETVDIFLDDVLKDQYDEFGVKKEVDYETLPKSSYTVKRGQSILYNSFRIWRELNLMEMSALLNRLTQSSVIRVIGVDTGDMPSEQVQVYLSRLKDKMEQKTAMQTGQGMAEYNNPAPIINTIYVPTHEGKGNITATTIGGDFDPKALTDIEYFRDKLFGSLKVPKQYFGFTSDSTGFNGGTSLTILSSRYGKTIKDIQAVLCQTVTDLINLFLIDRGLDNYVNKFTVRMQTPTTQEEIDRRNNTDNRIRYIGEVMNQLQDIEDKKILMTIKKELLSEVVDNSEISSLLQQYIDKLPSNQDDNQQGGGNGPTGDLGAGDFGGGFEGEEDFGGGAPAEGEEEQPMDLGLEPTEGDNGDMPSPAEVLPNESFYHDSNKDLLMETDGDLNNSYMPSPNDLGKDFTKHQD